MIMSARILILILACLVMTGCPHDIELLKMEEQLNHYSTAIRWGLWETASDFQPPAKRQPLDLGYLGTIHVTAYDTVYRQEQSGSDVVRQTVQIRYYREPSGVEKTITDRQTWRYDKEKDRWFLLSGLPEFK